MIDKYFMVVSFKHRNEMYIYNLQYVYVHIFMYVFICHSYVHDSSSQINI